MSGPSPLTTEALFHLGPMAISRPVVTTWALMAALSIGSWAGTRELRDPPNYWQATLEILVDTLRGQIRDITQRDPAPLLPLVGTLFVYLIAANLSGVLPGVEAPTAALETPAALTLVVFFSIQGYAIRARGVRGWLAGYLKPTPLLLPLNLLAEITRTFSMAVRLFGNTMSHELVIGVVLVLAGLLVPVPLMLLSVLIGVIQAYIFTVLAAVFLAAASESAERAPESP